MKNTLIILAVVLIAGAALYYFLTKNSEPIVVEPDQDTNSQVVTETPEETTEVVEESTERKPIETIGTSAGKHDITAYHYGDGDTEILFVGGIHGGYEWNTVLEAYQLMDYLDEHPEIIPSNVTVTVIPVLNPDGLSTVVGTTGRFVASAVPSSLDATIPGRFNSNNVDINRNFDCDWQAQGTWQDRTVSGGSAAFSEPESKAMKQYVEANKPAAVVVYYSAAGGVFSSNCHNGVLPETTKITNAYATASGYKAYESFDFYKITGDMVNWLAKEGIPGISVLLTNHTDVEWEKNRKGVEALLKYYSN